MRSGAGAKAWDLLAAFPVACWFGLVAFASLREVLHADAWAEAPVERAVQLANGIFALILIALFVSRPAPVARPAGWRAAAAGLIGGVAPMAIIFLPRGAIPPSVAQASNALILLATLASIWIVLALGRSFSILPQARALVTGGPYRFVRHPLYLAEFVALFALAWQFALPWSLLLWVVAAAAQFPRMHFEEQILSEAFPDYRDYAARTPRLLPRGGLKGGSAPAPHR